MIRTPSILLAGTLLGLAWPVLAQERSSSSVPAAAPQPKPQTSANALDISDPNWLSTEQERFIAAALSFDQIGIQQAYLRKLDMNMRRKGIPLLMCAAFAEPETGNFGSSQECTIEREGAVRILLHLGADVNAKEEVAKNRKTGKILYGDNLLLHALKIGNPFIIKIALDDAKIDVMVTDAKGETPLHLAVNPEYKTIHHVFVDSVLVEDRKLDKDRKVVSMETKSVKRAFRIDELVTGLIKHGADVDAMNAAGETPLLVIVKTMQILEKLESQPVKSQSDITDGSAYAQSRINLLLATRSLLFAGADVKLADTQGNTPLALAGTLKPGSLVRRMIEASAAGQRPTEVTPGAAATVPVVTPPPASAETVPAKPVQPPAKPPLRPVGEPPAPVPGDPNRPWIKDKDAPKIIDIK